MLTRRHFISGLSLASLAGCSSKKPGTQTVAKPPPVRRGMTEGVPLIEVFTKDADESSPILVAIHGRGDNPENWIAGWRNFPAPLHVVLPQAPTRFGDDGWSWFEFRDGMTDDQFGAEVGDAEAKLWPAVKAVAKDRKILVTGFSQGGILSYAIASRHPDVVAKAFPVSGSCPGPLIPKNKAKSAPVVAFHGTVDQVLDIKWDRGAINGFKEAGNEAELKEYPGIGHTISTPMRQDLWAEIQKALPLVQGPRP